MPYIPNTDDDRRKMLDKIGVASFDELLAPIPERLQLKNLLELPEPLSELELLDQLKALSRKNKSEMAVFAGGGVYDHFIPAAVETIIGRPEFATAYTPYQAEVAQGTLQVIYEFQTGICRLTGMDIANASMYDGGSAAAEAVNLSLLATKKNKVLVSETVNPNYRSVIRTYMSGRDVEFVTIPMTDGHSDLEKIKAAVDDNTACLVLAQPNFFGLLEEVEAAAAVVHEAGGLLVLAVDPIAAALIKPAAEYGADIAVGEGQPLGIPLNFGGPLLGFFAVTGKLVRQMPGRLAARTVDRDGKPGFVLTLQTREQHIRRDKATSNICTNQALCATAATVYLSLMGRSGLKQAALLSLEKTHRLVERIGALDGFEPYYGGSFIREAAIKMPRPAREIIETLIDRNNILAGIDLGRFYPDMSDGLLIAATEKRTGDQIDALVEALRTL